MYRMSHASRHGRQLCTTVVASIAGLLASAAIAQASVIAAPGYQVDDWATGFDTDAHGIGPVGVAPHGGKVYVGAFPSGRIYVFDERDGGVSGRSTELTAAPIAGQLTGLTFDRTGRLYGALKAYGAVVELSRADGRVLRTVASGLGCVVGLATDPLSGDLFVSTPCGPAGVQRIQDFATGTGETVRYSLTDGEAIDGIAFGADGTLYAASAAGIFRVQGTDQPSAGAAAKIAAITNADGIAVAAGRHAGSPPFLLAVTTTGIIARLDLTTTPARVSRIVSGGSRGDLAAVGSDGCLYATQSDRVIRVTQSDGTCRLLPTPPLAPLFTSVQTMGVATQSERAASAAAKRALSIVRISISARKLTRLRRVRVRIRLRGPALTAVRLNLVDARGRTVARGFRRRLAETQTLSLKRTRARISPGLARLRTTGSASGTRIRLVASRRLAP